MADSHRCLFPISQFYLLCNEKNHSPIFSLPILPLPQERPLWLTEAVKMNGHKESLSSNLKPRVMTLPFIKPIILTCPMFSWPQFSCPQITTHVWQCIQNSIMSGYWTLCISTVGYSSHRSRLYYDKANFKNMKLHFILL